MPACACSHGDADYLIEIDRQVGNPTGAKQLTEISDLAMYPGKVPDMLETLSGNKIPTTIAA